MTSPASELILYGTADCHLCEQAQRLLQQTLGAPIGERDITDDDALLDRYGVRIPVLRHCASGDELDWPFGEFDILTFLSDRDTTSTPPSV